MLQDLRDAVRALRAAPVVTGVAVLSLALGIGANTTIFSLVNSLLLRTLPVERPEDLAVLGTPDSPAPSWSYPVLSQLQRHEGSFAGVIAWSNQRFNTARSGETNFVEGFFVNGRYFDVLGVQPVIGRSFTERDDARRGGPDGPVAVISYSFWQTRFQGSPEAIGASILLERVPFTVIGVTPPEFFGTEVGRTFDVAVPFGTEPLVRERSGLDRMNMQWLQIILRRKPEQTIEAATAIVRGVQPQIREATKPTDWPPADAARYFTDPLTLSPAATGTSSARTRFERPMLALLAVVALVLLIACANIANLMLARSAARRREMSVRLALGASRARLARQLLVESLALAGAGAAAGLLFARWAGPLLVHQLSTTANRIALDVEVDGRVLAFTIFVTAFTAVLFGIAPAWRATRVDPNDALKEHGRGVAGEGAFGLGNLLVIVQIALSLVLVVASGLFIGTFARLAAVKLGFEADRVLVTTVNASRSVVKPDDRVPMYVRMRDAAAATAGVERAAISAVTPVAGQVITNRVEVPGSTDAMSERERSAFFNFVSPDFFATFHTRVLAGRDFMAGDRVGTPDVAIVNEAFARKFFGGANPVGRTVTQPGTPTRPAVTREVIGYVEDAIYRNLRQEPPPTLYVPLTQVNDPFFAAFPVHVSVRAAVGSPALLIRSVGAALNRVDPDVALTFRLTSDQVRASLVQERVVALLSGFFGGLALLLAGLGLYGVTSYAVSRRRTEIGIRVALGAAPSKVVAMVLTRVGFMVAAGIVVGSLVSAWAARFVSTLLFGVQPRDPATLVAAAVVLAAIGGVAGWLPARRASRVDPSQVLREV